MTDVLLKPEKASLASNTPVTKRMPMAPKNTRSARSFVNSSTVNIVSTVTMVIQACRPKPKNSIVSIIYLSFASSTFRGKGLLAPKDSSFSFQCVW